MGETANEPPDLMEVGKMAVLLFAIAAAVLALAVIAVLLVSVASRLEDSAWTLAGPAPGLLQAIARRIVGFHAEGIEWLRYARDEQYQNRVRATEYDLGWVESQPESPGRGRQ
jgi:hypothetical protein